MGSSLSKCPLTTLTSASFEGELSLRRTGFPGLRLGFHLAIGTGKTPGSLERTCLLAINGGVPCLFVALEARAPDFPKKTEEGIEPESGSLFARSQVLSLSSIWNLQCLGC